MPLLQPQFRLPLRHDNDIAAFFHENETEGGMSYGGLEPYWTNAPDKPDCGMCLQEINTEDKFAVDLDVSMFRPEELKMNLDDRILTVQGRQETQRPNAESRRSFIRVFTLPPDVDEDNMQSSLSNEGILHIEGPKVIFERMPGHHESAPVDVPTNKASDMP